MTITDIILIFVIVAISGVAIGLLGIRKAIENLTAEVRKSRSAEK